MRRIVIAVALTLAHPALSLPRASLNAQEATKRETFDAASIKGAARTSNYMMRGEPSGLVAMDATALDLIKYAFEVIERDVVGDLPSWMKTARFDIVARTTNPPLTPSRLRAMTRALLHDRFRLDASYEQATGRVLALVRERTDGRTGPNLRPSESTCQVNAPIPVFDPMPRKVLTFGDRCGFAYATSGGALDGVFGSRVTMQEFAAQLSRRGGYDRPIVNRTTLDGEFDLHTFPSADMVAPTSQARFVIALREQLGLTLRDEEGTYEVLRIRRIEQPSAN